MNCQFCQNKIDVEKNKHFNLMASKDLTMNVTFNCNNTCLTCFKHLSSVMLEFLAKEIRNADRLDSVKTELSG